MTSKFLRTGGFVGGIFLAWLISSAADAAPVIESSLFTQVRVGATNVLPNLAPDAEGYVSPTQSITFNQVGTSSLPMIPPTPWALDPAASGIGTGSASAAYGSLGGYSHVERLVDSRSNFAFYYLNSQSDARFSDSLTVDSLGLTGTEGSIVFDLKVEGTLTGTTNAYITARVTDVDRNVRVLDKTFPKLQDLDHLDVNSNLTSGAISFIYGEPFNFSIALVSRTAIAQQEDLEHPENFINNIGWATSDASSTMTLKDFQIYAGERLITDFRAISGSGTVYGSRAVPEPATLLLLSGGLISLFGLGKKRFFS